MNTDPRMMADAAKDDLLVLVDARDQKTGTATKLQAHVEGLLHRAFSVVLVRAGQTGPELLLSQRAEGKYHSSGLWANSCCSHPRDGEEVLEAAYRRTREELGCEACGLREISAFVYRAEFGNGLCEFEFDHVLIGHTTGEPQPDPTEVADVRWVSFDELSRELTSHPERFSAWAPMVLSLAMAAFRATDAA